MKNKYTIEELTLWIDNDEPLYLAWKRSRKPKRTFIKENRDALEEILDIRMNRKERLQ